MNPTHVLVIDRADCPDLAKNAPSSSEVVCGPDELLLLGRALSDGVERVHYAGGSAGRAALVSGFLGGADGTRTPCLVDHGATSTFEWGHALAVRTREVGTLRVVGAELAYPRVCFRVGLGRAVGLPLLLDGLETGSVSGAGLLQRLSSMVTSAQDSGVRVRQEGRASVETDWSGPAAGAVVSSESLLQSLPFKIPGSSFAGPQVLSLSAGSRFRPWSGLNLAGIEGLLRVRVSGEWSVDGWYQGSVSDAEMLVVPGLRLAFGRSGAAVV